MNILLFLPGLLVVLCQYRGLKDTVVHAVDILTIQVRNRAHPEAPADNPGTPASSIPQGCYRIFPRQSLLWLGIRLFSAVPIRVDGQLAIGG
jgi:hypothetical protein